MTESEPNIDDWSYNKEILFAKMDFCIKVNLNDYMAKERKDLINHWTAHENSHLYHYNPDLAYEDRMWWEFFRVPETHSGYKLKDATQYICIEGLAKMFMKVPLERLTPMVDDSTILMDLLRSLEEKPARINALVPLIARTYHDNNVVKFNANREDALFIAAMYCPSMPYVAGYIASILIEEDIDIDHRLFDVEETKLTCALVYKGDTHVGIVQELLMLRKKDGYPAISIARSTINGTTLLHRAVSVHKTLNADGIRIRSLETVKLLMSHGCDPLMQQEFSGNTALHLAVFLSRDPLLIGELILGLGRKALHIKNLQGNTPAELIEAMPNSELKAQLQQVTAI